MAGIDVAGGGTPSLTNQLTNTHIFVGDINNEPADVALTLSATGGAFALANTGVLTMPDANSTTRGLLTAGDWVAFNGKQNAINDWTTAFSAAVQATSSWSATNAAANVNAALVPKGTGAILASVPDGAITGGNARGTNAVDLQRVRSAANQVVSGSNSIIVGGVNNLNQGVRGFLGGGNGNKIEDIYSIGLADVVICGGTGNSAFNNTTIIVGGMGNSINGFGSVIVGGTSNSHGLNSQVSFIGGGQSNSAQPSQWGVIVGGQTNTISASHTFIGGGQGNTASVAWATIAGGQSNTASGQHAFVGAGKSCSASTRSAVSGGENNAASSELAFIGAGLNNNISAGNHYSFIGAGRSNLGRAQFSVICGGDANFNSGFAGVVGGGLDNRNEASYSSIVGGYQGYTTLYGQVSHASGSYDANTRGQAQAHELIWRRAITGAPVGGTELFLDGASVAAILPATNAVWHGIIDVSAICTATGNGTTVTGDVEATSYKVTIKRIGTNTVLVGTVQEIGTTNADASMSTATFTIDNNNTNESLRIVFTSPTTAGTTTTFRALAVFRGLQIQY